MTYLLDTNVVSELTRPRPHARVIGWLEATGSSVYWVSVLTLGEAHRGIARLRHRGDHRQADGLEPRIATIEAEYADRFLPVDTAVARAWSDLGITQPMSTPDALIAATALVHGLTLVTRNVSDFTGAGVPIVNPFDP